MNDRSIFQRLYFHLPPLGQNIAISLYGLRWGKQRFGGVFKKECQNFGSREFYTEKQWARYQEDSLRKILLHSFLHVPFYRKKYSQNGWKKEHFEKFQLADLPKLPFLEKSELRDFGTTGLLAVNKSKKGIFVQSSGSTGTPVQLFFSPAFHQKWMAAMEARVRHWAGVDFRTPRGTFGGRHILPPGTNQPPFFRRNYTERQTYFSAYHISPENAENYLKGMQKWPIEYLTGYAFSNYTLAKIFREHNLQPPAMKCVITSAEKLTSEMRREMEAIYSCRVFDSYSGAEACGLVSESPEGKLLQSPDTGVMEILDETGREVDPGASGEIIFTGLLNFDQPLIRYRIGDRGQKGEERGAVGGRYMPVLADIVGRIEDGIKLKDGRTMVRFHSVFYSIPGLIRAQIVQRDWNRFLIRIEKTHNFDPKSEKIIEERMRSQLGPDAVLGFEYPAAIEPGPNGKFQAVVSDLKNKIVQS